MSYSDFSLAVVKEKFSLTLNEKISLFSQIAEQTCSSHLQESLKTNIHLAVAINTEKARSELIVAPVLVELVKQFNQEISLFSGVELNIDKAQGLNGICDFVISLSSEQFFLDAPIITLVEAKNDNLNSGLGQCISEMVGSRIFNEQKQNQLSTNFGVVTTGSLLYLEIWRQENGDVAPFHHPILP